MCTYIHSSLVRRDLLNWSLIESGAHSNNRPNLNTMCRFCERARLLVHFCGQCAISLYIEMRKYTLSRAIAGTTHTHTHTPTGKTEKESRKNTNDAEKRKTLCDYKTKKIARWKSREP